MGKHNISQLFQPKKLIALMCKTYEKKNHLSTYKLRKYQRFDKKYLSKLNISSKYCLPPPSLLPKLYVKFSFSYNDKYS